MPSWKRLLALAALALAMGVAGFFTTRGCARSPQDAPDRAAP